MILLHNHTKTFLLHIYIDIKSWTDSNNIIIESMLMVDMAGGQLIIPSNMHTYIQGQYPSCMDGLQITPPPHSLSLS